MPHKNSTIDFKGLFKEINRLEQKIKDLEMPRSRRWVKSIVIRLQACGCANECGLF
jgi:hypothetical protein